jgi:hypothetical protein
MPLQPGYLPSNRPETSRRHTTGAARSFPAGNSPGAFHRARQFDVVFHLLSHRFCMVLPKADASKYGAGFATAQKYPSHFREGYAAPRSRCSVKIRFLVLWRRVDPCRCRRATGLLWSFTIVQLRQFVNDVLWPRCPPNEPPTRHCEAPARLHVQATKQSPDQEGKTGTVPLLMSGEIQRSFPSSAHPPRRRPPPIKNGNRPCFPAHPYRSA